MSQKSGLYPTNFPPQHMHLSTAENSIRTSDIRGSLGASPCFAMFHGLSWTSGCKSAAFPDDTIISGMRCSFRYCVLQMPQNFAAPGVWIARKDNAQRAIYRIRNQELSYHDMTYQIDGRSGNEPIVGSRMRYCLNMYHKSPHPDH